jgi:signal transduction histidine kinase
VARASCLELFVAWVYCVIYMAVVMLVTKENYVNAAAQLSLCTAALVGIKMGRIGIEPLLKLAIFFATLINASLVIHNGLKQDIPPFYGFYGSNMLLLPVATHYFVRRSWFMPTIAATLATLLGSFCWSLGRDFSFTFSAAEQLPLLAFGVALVFFPSLFMTLSDAEKQVYLLLLSRKLGRAEDRSEAKSAFIARMSHELRTPLHGLLSSAELLRQTALDEEQEEYLSMVHSCGQLLLDLVFKILDLSKIEAGTFSNAEVPFSLFEALGQLARAMAGLAEDKGLELAVVFDLHPEGYDVEGDKSHLLEILTTVRKEFLYLFIYFISYFCNFNFNLFISF